VTDALEATATASENLTVALNISALGNVTFGADPLPVGFQSHVVGGVPGYAYEWKFGDGSTSVASDPDHVYTRPGSYRAAVTVTDQAGQSGSGGWNVTVAPGGGPISVQVAVASPQIGLGSTETISAVVTGGTGDYSLTWTGVPAGCLEAGLVGLECTPTATGSFLVSLGVVDSHGDQGVGSAAFTVGGSNPGGPLPAPGTTTTVYQGISPTLAWELAVLGIAIAAVLGVAVGAQMRTTRLPPHPEHPTTGQSPPDTPH
jgi:hypothetical protein